ncbi:3-oxoacyl-[acyl-carrier-protein] reductase isoform X3 [Callorhinus ursinus]|uniref:3-ketoacyl-[acyl-carrier-protein] reductase beta subunit n=2 Tax=Otariidae TaxID=9702 RepID=A0A3Q7P8V4_CALUR|nr:carbonyl reductase family member 4 isoform X2 [Callorhinus ursinus]XP_027456143.1 carbonyl reductase family member 4 isoform X2 [Zalophus californianus]XP_027960237.1 carbonyl reductase family member 4 isoform X2 [Eumetopias jubatus]
MDKVCAVFGGSRGIGRAVAQLMAPKGYRLAIIARNLEMAKAAAGELGGDHLAFSCDVAKERDVQNTFEEMEKNLGRVNFLVNAAGINRDSLLVRTKTEDMISQLHTNLLGSMLTCKVALKTMIQQQRGSIVNVGFVHTDMTKDLKEEHLKKNIPLGRFGEPIDVAHAVVFLLESPYITGHVLVVDGGLQLMI